MRPLIPILTLDANYSALPLKIPVDNHCETSDPPPGALRAPAGVART